AEGGLGTAEGVRRRGRSLASREDADLRLGGQRTSPPGVVRPRRGRSPLATATELPGTGVALGQDSSSRPAAAAASRLAGTGFAPGGAAIASTTSPSASKLWPLTSASQCPRAARMPAVPTEKSRALTRGLTQTIL